MAVYKRKDRDTWVARLTGPDGRLVQNNFARKTDAMLAINGSSGPSRRPQAVSTRPGGGLQVEAGTQTSSQLESAETSSTRATARSLSPSSTSSGPPARCGNRVPSER
jgi:hypothetical protein